MGIGVSLGAYTVDPPVDNAVAAAEIAPPGGLVLTNGVGFDGVTSRLRNSALTGSTSGIGFLLSLWFNFLGGDSNLQTFIHQANERIALFRHTDGTISIQVEKADLNLLWHAHTTASYDTVSNPGWHHILVAASLGATGQIYIDDVSAPRTDLVGPLAGTIDFGTSPDYGIGAERLGGNKFQGEMADLWFNQTFLDISILANRRKFIDAAGKPVVLGATGQLPLGSDPIIFMSGDTANWQTNKGTGGGFTLTGVLANATSNPSD